MSREELIDYLESKDFTAEEINKLLIFSGIHKKVDIILILEFIFDILTYINLNEEQIKLFVLQNTGVLFKDKSEIVKIAYVLNEIDVINRIFGRLEDIKGIHLYKRVFMRNLVANYSKRYNDFDGARFLICRDVRAYGSKYGLELDIYNLFKQHVFSDSKLEKILDKHLKIGEEHVTVDKYIEVNSKLFYNKYLMSKLRKGKQR